MLQTAYNFVSGYFMVGTLITILFATRLLRVFNYKDKAVNSVLMLTVIFTWPALLITKLKEKYVQDKIKKEMFSIPKSDVMRRFAKAEELEKKYGRSLNIHFELKE